MISTTYCRWAYFFSIPRTVFRSTSGIRIFLCFFVTVLLLSHDFSGFRLSVFRIFRSPEKKIRPTVFRIVKVHLYRRGSLSSIFSRFRCMKETRTAVHPLSLNVFPSNPPYHNSITLES